MEMRRREQIYLLDDAQFQHYWPDIRKELARIPQYEVWMTDEMVFEAAVKGAMQFWALSDGQIQCILMTEIRSYPGGRALRFVGAVGKKFDDFLTQIEDIFGRVARSLNCNKVEVVGTRRGWYRKLRKLGFEFSHEILMRDVEKMREH